MDRTEFLNELQELAGSMSQEEIEKALDALRECRPAVYRETFKGKGELALLCETMDAAETDLPYIDTDGNTGELHVLGGTLLPPPLFDTYRSDIPICSKTEGWWLFERQRVAGSVRGYESGARPARIRPALVIDGITGGLTPNQCFRTGNETFMLLSRNLAIRQGTLDSACTVSDNVYYRNSVIRYCVNGWFKNLVRKSGRSADAERK